MLGTGVVAATRACCRNNSRLGSHRERENRDAVASVKKVKVRLGRECESSGWMRSRCFVKRIDGGSHDSEADGL